MRPGNKILFLGKISPKSHFIYPQTWTCKWISAQPSWVLWSAWVKCMIFIWDLQLVFQMVHNLHSEEMIFSEKKNDDKMENFHQGSQRSSSEVVPDIRNGMKIFSPVSGWMMACVQRAWHHPHAARSPETSMYGGAVNLGCLMNDESLTCLIFWASHSCTGMQSKKGSTINHLV